jgi:hypothetical protein
VKVALHGGASPGGISGGAPHSGPAQAGPSEKKAELLGDTIQSGSQPLNRSRFKDWCRDWSGFVGSMATCAIGLMVGWQTYHIIEADKKAMTDRDGDIAKRAEQKQIDIEPSDAEKQNAFPMHGYRESVYDPSGANANSTLTA